MILSSFEDSNSTFRIERDYRIEGGPIQFCTDHYPQNASLLHGRLDQEQLAKSIAQLNYEMRRTLSITAFTTIRRIFAFITFELSSFIIPDVSLTRLNRLIREQNKTIYHPNDLHLQDPSLCAFQYLEIQKFNGA